MLLNISSQENKKMRLSNKSAQISHLRHKYPGSNNHTLDILCNDLVAGKVWDPEKDRRMQ